MRVCQDEGTRDKIQIADGQHTVDARHLGPLIVASLGSTLISGVEPIYGSKVDSRGLDPERLRASLVWLVPASGLGRNASNW